MAPSPATRPLYQPIGFVVVRAPLLPVETYATLRTTDVVACLDDPSVRRALVAASTSLVDALDRFERSALTPKDAERLKATLLRYVIRMSTRPTPFGLFAGCAAVSIADHTDLAIVSAFGGSHTRPDMAWLMRLVADAEADPAIRRHLLVHTNPLTRLDGDRVELAQRMPGGRGVAAQTVSVRRTGAVVRALELARRGISYRALAETLLQSTPGAEPEKVEGLLAELCEQTLLLTDLRPPLTTDSPAQHVVNRLSEIEEAHVILRSLEAVLDAARRWDSSSHADAVSGFRGLLDAAGASSATTSPVVQTDLRLNVRGSVSAEIASTAARAAELLLQLSPTPRGLSALAAYRSAFVARYGHEREIPLLELLDPQRGLGSVSGHGHAPVGPDAARAEARSRTLLTLATTALRTGQRVLPLDQALIDTLATSACTPCSVPVSLDVSLLIGARCAADIDAGRFTAVVGPNLGAWAAGRNFGRFADLHPPEEGRNRLATLARAEEDRYDPDCLWAELSYMPSNVRSANVAIRPAIRQYEVVVGVSPGVAADRVIPLDELRVGVDEDRLYVRWATANRRVRLVSGHMLNDFGAPPVVQFLSQVSSDGIVPFTPFDWGPAEGFPFLPRVQTGRLVLRPAEWRLARVGVPDTGTLAAWRREWDVPRQVWLATGDNRLLLDLDEEIHRALLWAELKKLSDDRSLLLQEVIPALDEVWLEGAEGHYYSEIIVPLVIEHGGDAAAVEARREHAIVRPPAETPLSPAMAAANRQCPPGSKWLFVKLYCVGRREDEVIATSLLPFASNAVAAGLADGWFYVRYADPAPHLRVRFHGDPGRLSGPLFGQACQWARGLLDEGALTRVAFDTYEREIERFGGESGMQAAERLFHADSVLCAELVGLLQSKAWNDDATRTVLFCLTSDDLLAAMGFEAGQRLEWYRSEGARFRKEFGDDYRTHKAALREALGSPAGWLAARNGGASIEAALARRRESLQAVAAELRRLDAEHAMTQPLSRLCTSYLHLHLNRLGGAMAERRVLGLLLRTREGLTRSPAS